MAAIRRTAIFSGRVQGVFFRATTCDVARRFDVVGTVRNLPDGRVELVAEGQPAELDAFVEAVRRAKEGFIQDLQIEESPALGDLRGFGVRY